MALNWSKVAPLCRDAILKTSKGYLLESNTPRERLLHLLDKLKQDSTIDSYTETAARTNNRTPATSPETFAAVITQVDYEIENETISRALKVNNIAHRYCMRIISRATFEPTTVTRVITGSSEAYTY